MDEIRILSRYHAEIRPYIRVFLAAILFDIGMTLLGLTTPLFTRILFDYAYPLRDLGLLNVTVVAIVVAYFLYFFLSVLSDYLQIYIQQGASASLTSRVFEAIERLPLAFHQEKKPGDLLVRITDDVGRTIGMVANVLPTLIIDGGRFFIILAIAFFVNAKLTLLALVSIPLYVMEARFYAWRLARVQGESIDADSDIISRAQEKLSGIKTIKAFGQERNETLSLGKLIRRRYRVAVKGSLLGALRTFTNSLTLQIWSVFMMWYLGFQVVQGKLTIGEIVALMLYLEQLGDPIHSFINLFTDWKQGLVSMRRLDEVLLHPAEDEGLESTARLLSKEGEVAASRLSFSYAPGAAVLHEVDVEFSPRSVTAIVGASGSGKTTLVNLIMRFFRPTSGAIMIDGQDISEVSIGELRGHVGIVEQEASLFDGTVIENILYGNAGMGRGDAMCAARLSGAHDFIERLPGGYDAPVGTGGELLSAGQRQRVAIARTLLRDPKVVIFDEATSSLDAESEFRIGEAVTSLARTRTVIVIAHRLSTIKSAGKILVLDAGRFVEQGAFDELMEKRGHFYRFYWRQFGGLASFRQQLTLELERASRYGSKFCAAALRLAGYEAMKEREGIAAADRLADGVESLLKRSMRTGDSSAVLFGGVILMILPEIEKDQLLAFFKRMKGALPAMAGQELGIGLKAEELIFAGTRITKKTFRTPDELISAIIRRLSKANSNEITGEEDLAADFASRKGT